MLNVFHIPKPQNGFVSVFPGSSTNTNMVWNTWEKPAGITMIYIVCIGSGGGGSSGFPSATATARGGGAGGGSGSLTTALIPAAVLPDTLYVIAGHGGLGGASSTSVANPGGFGTSSTVAIAPDINAIYRVCLGTSGIGSLTVATASAAGIGGQGGATVSIASNVLMAGLGIFTPIASQAGASGGAAANGNGLNITYPTNGLLLSGGAGGGGGSTGAGGHVLVPGTQTSTLNLFTQVSGGANGAVAGNGSSGHERLTPLLATGGSGGAANSGNARGGDGGNGGFGSGGGGGGAGGTTGGGGAGGNGGPGLVLIYSW